MSISRCGTSYKRAPSTGHRRRSAEREQTTKADTDSFWAVKTPMKVRMQSASSSPNLAKHNWQRKKLMNLMKKDCTECKKKIPMSTISYKCSNSNCTAHVHEGCCARVTTPCVISHETVSSKRALIEVCTIACFLSNNLYSSMWRIQWFHRKFQVFCIWRFMKLIHV